MGDLEERLLLSSLKQPLSWFRFIDDVDMKWIHISYKIDPFDYSSDKFMICEFFYEK
jgi:hypothetical protein